MVGQATLAFGPTLLGLARDATGSYGAALGLCMALQLLGRRSCLPCDGEGVEALRHGAHTRWTVGHRPEAARRTV